MSKWPDPIHAEYLRLLKIERAKEYGKEYQASCTAVRKMARKNVCKEQK